MTTATIHVFEARGLGRAPFHWLGVEEHRGPIRQVQASGVEVLVGAPGQPMGTCAYCGTGIAECHIIRSADGKEFIVGSDSVMKTGDAGLKHRVNEARREAANKRADERIAEAFRILGNRPAIRGHLAAQPYARSHKLGWIVFVRDYGGRTGKLKAARFIEQAVRELGPENVDAAGR